MTIVAHLGGALAGVLLGVIILKDWHVNRRDLICQITSAFLFLVMALTVMSLMIVDRQKHADLMDSASNKTNKFESLKFQKSLMKNKHKLCKTSVLLNI